MKTDRSAGPGILKAMRVRTRRALAAFVEDESGQNQLEFGLVAGLVSLCAIASMKGLANAISAYWQYLATGIAGA